MTELAKKISLTQAIHSMQQLFPEEFQFYPKSWIIPAQLLEFQKYCVNRTETSWFIVKPDEGKISLKKSQKIFLRGPRCRHIFNKFTRATAKYHRSTFDSRIYRRPIFIGRSPEIRFSGLCSY